MAETGDLGSGDLSSNDAFGGQILQIYTFRAAPAFKKCALYRCADFLPLSTHPTARIARSLAPRVRPSQFSMLSWNRYVQGERRLLRSLIPWRTGA